MRAIVGLNLVVDLYGGTVAQLEYAGSDDFVARIYAGNHTHLIAARSRQLDDLLAHAAVGIAFLVLQIGNDEDRIAVGSIVDSRGRQGYHRCALAKSERNLDKHSGAQLVLRIGQSRLHLYVASGFVHDGIKRRNVARE